MRLTARVAASDRNTRPGFKLECMAGLVGSQMQAGPMNAWKRAKAVRIVPALPWIALFIFAFGLGLIYAVARYPRINDSVAMVWLTFEQLSNKGATGNWYPARFEHSGVLRHDAARTQPGYTLYALAPDLSAHLIDMNGRELHQWSLSREDVMPGAARQRRTFFGMLEPQVEGGHLFSNGARTCVWPGRGAF